MTAIRAPAIEAVECTPPTRRAAVHLPQLDGLRALAVGIVIWQHAGLYDGSRAFAVHGVGIFGVWIFFVLSSYLITGILLRAKDSGAQLGESLRVFYLRRVLRIMPAYYACLALAVALRVPLVPGELTAHALYLTRGMVPAHPQWSQALEHVWSLAVEEQFYLVWPLVVLLVSASWIPKILWVAVIGGAVLRMVILEPLHANVVLGITSSASSVDPFGIGGLLAWHAYTRPHAVASRVKWCRYGTVAGCALVALSLSPLNEHTGRNVAFYGAETLAVSAAAAWLVNAAVNGSWPVFGWKPIVYLGSISYGIYLYHELVIYSLGRLRFYLPGLGAWVERGSMAHLAAVSVMSIAVAALSARYLEQPVNGLKRLVPYQA